MEIKVKGCRCKFCDYVWPSKVDKPKACPQCKRYGYDTDDKVEVSKNG